MTRIGIYGALGRMGQAIADTLGDHGATLSGGADLGDDPEPVARAADVLVDFSNPHALEAHLRAARAAGTPILIGTTGLSAQHHARIDEAAASLPVLQTGNTSLGVALLQRLVRESAARLGTDWDIEIVEAHHRNKLDAPSGTALMLGQAAADGLGTTLAEAAVMDRAGLTGARATGTIGFASVRGGTLAGDHQVMFAGNGEMLTLAHRAEDRSIFATGAIRAALWLVGRAPGRYTMADVLGL